MKVRHPQSKDPVKYRLYYLPGQLIRARAKVIALEAEARRYGLEL